MKKTLAVKRIFKNEKDFCLEASVRRMKKTFVLKQASEERKKLLQ